MFLGDGQRKPIEGLEVCRSQSTAPHDDTLLDLAHGSLLPTPAGGYDTVSPA